MYLKKLEAIKSTGITLKSLTSRRADFSYSSKKFFLIKKTLNRINMKSVIITGCSKGIGFETALAFGRVGYKVFATMRNPNKDTQLKKIIQEELLSITLYAMDVDSDESVKQGINDILQSYGSIDVLVNNAGIEYHGSIEEVELSKFKAIMETNYFGTIRCIKQVLPHMRKNRKGCIINVSSVAGRISSSPLGPYAASKFALEAMSEALAQEVKSFNIKVRIVEPGIIDTQMARDIAAGGKSIYPQTKRNGSLFGAALKNTPHPSIVANKILEVAESDSWQLRHPIGPDAKPFLDYRASKTDEEYVDMNAAPDEEWYKAIEHDFGLNLRPAIPTI